MGHAPEMVDGDRQREPLNAVFHNLSLGTLSVDAFFLLSGYLITQSMCRSSTVGRYMERRVLRIYPAFIASYLLMVLVLAPLVGGNSLHGFGKTLLNLFLLKAPPAYAGQLAGLPYPALNGSMWTIAYEFRCYLLVALAFMLGLLRHRYVVLLLTAATIVLAVATTFPAVQIGMDAVHPLRINVLIGQNSITVQLTAAFLVGSCAYLFWREIESWLTGPVAAASAAAVGAILFVPHVAEAGMIVFGSLPLFWLALKARLGKLQRINDDWDISYGCYLYGWPVAITILYFNPGISPWLLAAVSLPLALLCGAASWWGLEKWTKDWSRSRRAGPDRTRGQAPSPAGGSRPSGRRRHVLQPGDRSGHRSRRRPALTPRRPVQNGAVVLRK